MLTDEQRRLWDVYEDAERRAPREEKLLALNAFLDILATASCDQWFPWARSIAATVVDERADFVIRQPLFERAIFPALFDGYQCRLPGCARWLAGLHQHLLRSKECRDSLHDGWSEISLLQAAVQHDPDDQASRNRLIPAMAAQLRHSIHELPAGVLFGMDGATPDQCLELESDLDVFSRLVSLEGRQDGYAELIETCRLHFTAYREFLLQRDRHQSYASYLVQLQRGISAT